MNFRELHDQAHSAVDIAVDAETLAVVSEALAACLERNDWREACATLLQRALDLTDSESGFIGVIIADTLRVLAQEGNDWGRLDNLELSDNVVQVDDESGHFHVLLKRAVASGEVVIANLPAVDGLPADPTINPPALHSFLTAPILAGEQPRGMLVLAKRTGDFHTEDQRRVETLVRHVGGLFTSYHQHVTAKAQEQERLAAEAQLRRIAGHAARLGGWTIDLDEQKLVWSDEVCAIHDLPPGYTPTLEEGLGYFPPEVRGEVVLCMEACARDGTPYDLELPKYTATGRSIWVRSIGEAVRDQSGRIVRLQGAFQDISERRRITESLRESEKRLRQSQKMEAIGRLAGGIAHDFNNLLTVINGYSENMLEQAGLDPGLQDSARMINEAGIRAAALTSQLLGFSRQSILQPKVVDLNTVVLESCKLLRRLIGTNIHINTVLEPIPNCVRVDSLHMDQVLVNLAINARDAMPQGGILTIETANVELGTDFATLHPGCKPGPHVMLAITDTGAGMTPEVLALIFDPFFTTREVGKGSGLGLAMVSGIVEQSGGWIHATSEPGRGTTFRIYLPALVDTASTQPAAALKSPQVRTETILLVEDETSLRNMLRASLGGQGYKVLTAVDGKNGLQVIQAYHDEPALVLTDMIMPNLGGAEMVKELRALFPRLKVLFMSGYIDVASLRDGQWGANSAFIQKPFSTSTLLQKIRQLLDA